MDLVMYAFHLYNLKADFDRCQETLLITVPHLDTVFSRGS